MVTPVGCSSDSTSCLSSVLWDCSSWSLFFKLCCFYFSFHLLVLELQFNIIIIYLPNPVCKTDSRLLSQFYCAFNLLFGLPCGQAGKESACSAGGMGLVPGSGKFPGEGNGYPLQYSSLENSMDYIIHGIAKSRTRLNDFHFHFQSHLMSKKCLSMPFPSVVG